MTATTTASAGPSVGALGDTVPKLMLERVRQHPDRVVFREKKLGIWEPVRWKRYGDDVAALALALRDRGIGHRDRVAVHSENRPEWVFADVAIESLGAIVVGIYPTSPAAELRYVLQNSGARILIAEDQEQVDKAIEVWPDCPALERVIVIEPRGTARYGVPRLETYDVVLAEGRVAVAAEPLAFAHLVASTSAEDVAVLVYTSGTTGPPKGAMLTHANGLVASRGFIEAIGGNETDTNLAYLPLCHLAERVWTLYAPVLVGTIANFAESIDTVQRDIYEIAPTFFGAVPRIMEKMRSGVESRVADSSRVKRANYAFWIAQGRGLAAKRLANNGHLGGLDRLRYGLGDVMLFRSLRDRLGMKRVRHCLIGTAPVAPELMEYFHAIGIRMIQAYGQTECGGASHAHRGWDIRFDTVGVLLPTYEYMLDEATSEVLLRGPGNFVGYWGNPEASASAFADGWLHTGDQGVIAEGGHLKIIGRIKDIIITAGGKNISPSEIENKLKFSPYIAEAILIGESRPYLTALIGIEFDTVSKWAEKRGIAYTTFRDLSERPEVVVLVTEWVDQVNTQLARVETVRKFRLLPKELDQDDEELTATQKVKRSVIARRFENLISEMYRVS